LHWQYARVDRLVRKVAAMLGNGDNTNVEHILSICQKVSPRTCPALAFQFLFL